MARFRNLLKSSVVVGLWLVATAVQVRAMPHTPESPEVRAIVDRAVGFMNTVTPKIDFGREALIGYALLKADVPKDHPRLQTSLKVVVDKIAEGLNSRDPPHIYPAAVAAIFLLEYDDKLFAPQIQHCLDLMKTRQRPGGGFAYPNQQVADISQTQYGVLAFWLADKHGFEVDPQMGLAALNYLMINQDPTGGFSYQGASRNDRGVSHSMSAAGGGSLFIAASWLGYGNDADSVTRRPEEKGLPPSVRLVLIDERTGKPIDRRQKRNAGKVDLDEGRLRGAEGRAEGWFNANFRIGVNRWQYYYLYGYERYASFVEASKGISDPEPDWYNQGVEFIKATQRQDGSFPDEKDEADAPDVSTAFAILFLVRSTKKALVEGEYSDGRLLGGQGLSDEAATVMKGGRVVSLAVGRSVDDMKGLLSQTGGDADFGKLDSIDLLTIDDSSPDIRDRQLATIRNLVAHQNPKLRWLAVRALGNYQDLENMPPLIYALTDPEKQIVEFANRSLLQIARKFDDGKYMLPESFEPNDNKVEELRKRWVEFYFTVQPNGELYRPTIQ